MTRPERRAAPRIASELPLHLVDEAAELKTQTKNISASGAYCTLRRFIAPMTKLQVRLEVPAQAQSSVIQCQGVVVRVEPPSAESQLSQYNVAIFFVDLTDYDRSIIARYVQQQLQLTTSGD